MLLTTHDLYDLHAVFVNIRHAPDTKETYAVIVRLKALFDNWDFDPQADGNIIRRTLRPAAELDRERYHWVDTDNVYAYTGKIFKPEHPVYSIFRTAFESLFQNMKGMHDDNVALLADAFHNVPLILCEKEGKGYRRRLEKELTAALRLYGSSSLFGTSFLGDLLKSFPR